MSRRFLSRARRQRAGLARRPAGGEIPLRLRLYVLATMLAAAAAAGAAVALSDGAIIAQAWLIAPLAVLVAVEGILAVRLRKGSEGEAQAHEEAFVVFMALLLSPPHGLAALAAGVLVAQLATRHGPLKAAFNTAQFVGSGALAFLVVAVLAPDELGLARVLAALAAVLVFSLANRALVAGALAFAGGSSFRADVFDHLLSDALFWAGSVSIGLLAGIVGAAYPWALPFALAAMLVLSLGVAGHHRARREQEALGALVDSSPAAIFSVDRGGLVQAWNPEMARLTDRPSGEAVGRPVADVVSFRNPDGTETDDLLSPATLATPSERRLLRVAAADGGERWLTVGRAGLPDGGFAFVGQDVTEQREIEARHRRLVEQLPLAVYIDVMAESRNLMGKSAYFSPQIEAMLGYPPDEWRADPELFTKILHPKDRERVLAEIRQARAHSDRFRSEYRLMAKDGREVWILDEAVYLRDDEGALTTIEGYFVEVSERKALESDLLQAQKLEAVGSLAGGVAHDFNNMMSAVVGFGELVLARLEEGHPLREHVAQMKRAGEQAAEMTQQLLAFSRKQVLQPKVLDLNTVVSDSQRLLERLIREDVELACVLDPELERVEADPGQLEQVIVNLAVNARDAMPEGGKLTIETANVELGADYAASHVEVEPGPYVLLAVTDTGTGMDAQTRARIFEPFFTTKESGKGTGLGLATVFGIVKQSGGHLSVYSEPGHGTTFRVYLRRTDSAPAAEEASAAPGQAPGGQETLLVVEDEELVRSLEYEVLTQHGYTVLQASSPLDALKLAARHEGPIDLLLTDVVMPGMSGSELAERLGPLRPEMQVLYTSGYAGEAIVRHGVLTPGIAFLPKPVTPDALARKVREVLDTKAQKPGYLRVS